MPFSSPGKVLKLPVLEPTIFNLESFDAHQWVKALSSKKKVKVVCKKIKRHVVDDLMPSLPGQTRSSSVDVQQLIWI
jgi:expansin (peptidoglycan-binding protein)